MQPSTTVTCRQTTSWLCLHFGDSMESKTTILTDYSVMKLLFNQLTADLFNTDGRLNVMILHANKKGLHQSDLSDRPRMILTLLSARSPIYLTPWWLHRHFFYNQDKVLSQIALLDNQLQNDNSANITVLTVTGKWNVPSQQNIHIELDFLLFLTLIRFRLPACVGRFTNYSYLQ